jgi:hypothetical protein
VSDNAPAQAWLDWLEKAGNGHVTVEEFLRERDAALGRAEKAVAQELRDLWTELQDERNAALAEEET